MRRKTARIIKEYRHPISTEMVSDSQGKVNYARECKEMARIDFSRRFHDYKMVDVTYTIPTRWAKELVITVTITGERR